MKIQWVMNKSVGVDINATEGMIVSYKFRGERRKRTFAPEKCTISGDTIICDGKNVKTFLLNVFAEWMIFNEVQVYDRFNKTLYRDEMVDHVCRWFQEAIENPDGFNKKWDRLDAFAYACKDEDYERNFARKMGW